jgi:hypothetical protein
MDTQDGTRPVADQPVDAPGLFCAVDRAVNEAVPEAVASCRATSLWNFMKVESTGKLPPHHVSYSRCFDIPHNPIHEASPAPDYEQRIARFYSFYFVVNMYTYMSTSHNRYRSGSGSGSGYVSGGSSSYSRVSYGRSGGGQTLRDAQIAAWVKLGKTKEQILLLEKYTCADGGIWIIPFYADHNKHKELFDMFKGTNEYANFMECMNSRGYRHMVNQNQSTH